MNAVELNKLNFKYKSVQKRTLENVNLIVNQGEILAICGVSGSGKSTLCNCICGLIPNVYEGEYSGEVKIFGQDISLMSRAEIATNIGIIFQNPSTQLFSPTIEDELAFGPENLCVDRNEIAMRIDEILKIINMEEYRYENPNSLSGGQQQLIAIASVLMLNPKIIICDEIMSWIDEGGKEIIKNLLMNLKKQGKTIIIVEHDIENLKIADRVINI
ncbi:energy-coupling factor transport system ATP-binding protein [Sedimentibacter acidaminivorans]|uniref:Energy-coupling factor transport system ATP-binding protein n=1 Tax=Sedimentibacter acidaminivorans TaxID=913099 RepID=A0ABS4GDQ3_9FIRM|nr:ABC transporter ATP-binding protein [Sedimentibacter acidaminivorans]MBP1925818.1 energy-coupling factor transport system ATP-binding protein [Sedimentibacter acidaminivorans]